MKTWHWVPVVAMAVGLWGIDVAIAADAPAMAAAEVKTLLNDKTLFMVDRAQGRSYGNAVRMYFAPDGSLAAQSSSGMSNSGTWEVKEDGLMCNTWRDDRWRASWCYTLHRDGDDVDFIATTASPQAFTGLKWVMKSSKDGNQM